MRDSRPSRFQNFADRKSEQAAAASIETLSTLFDHCDHGNIRGIGNAWTRMHYDGDFGLFVPSANETAISLVFVQSRTGNTGAVNPGALGGGATDEHLIYEGLSRAAADAVLAGAGSVYEQSFFSVWHPQVIALRNSLGLPRHPAQIVVSKQGRLNFDALLFNVPEVSVFLLAGEECISRHAPALDERPWIRSVLFAGDNLRPALDHLRVDEGIYRISAIGGRFTQRTSLTRISHRISI